MPAYPDFALHERLLRCARDRYDAATLALAGTMALAVTRPPGYRSPIAGLEFDDWSGLEARCFPGARLALLAHDETPRGEFDEFEDLVALLLAHADDAQRDPPLARWLAHAVATACTGANHLWQDLGLPGRDVLNRLMAQHFGALKARNAGDMKWKKFFYRCLCEQAEVLICKSPSCSACPDQPACFGVEQGAGLMPLGGEAPAGSVRPRPVEAGRDVRSGAASR